MTTKNTRRGFTQIKRVGQALPDNAPVKGHIAAFTLIELLVVVLIIGILSAIAVPQYQKAVEKSHAAEAISILRAVIKAQQVYYLEHGKYAQKFDELVVEMPWEGRERYLPARTNLDVRSNGKWSLMLESSSEFEGFMLGRLNGKYKGVGLDYYFKHSMVPQMVGTISCVEDKHYDGIYSLEFGDYCEKILNLSNKIYSTGDTKIWKMD